MGASITISGKLFAQLTDRIGSIPAEMQQVAEKAVKESGTILEKGLRESVTNDGGLSFRAKKRLIKCIKPMRIVESNVVKVRGLTGWEFDNSNVKKNDDGRIAQYLSYGTDERYTRKGQYRGKVEGTQFVARTLRKKAKYIKAKQKQIIGDYLKSLGE